MELPKCHYCGQFVNPRKEGIGSRDIYSHLSCDDTIYYHLKCEPMEKETPKTAEEILSGQPAYYFGASTYYEKEDVRKILEEYAEQARKEERERHKDMVRYMEYMLSITNTITPSFSRIKDALAAAGYGKEEK